MYPLTYSPTAVEAPDLSNDGQPDLLVARTTGLNVLINTGNDSFETAVDYQDGQPFDCVASADIDADGDIDVASGSRDVNGVKTFLNLGTGLLAAPSVYPVAGPVQSLRFAQLDSDSYPDLVALTDSGWVTLLNQKDGTFGSATPVSPRGSLDLADFDLDGHTDIVLVSETFDQTVPVLRNAGDGSFAPVGAYVSTSANWGSALAVADFDEDTRPDIAMWDPFAGTVRVLPNRDSTAFDDWQWQEYHIGGTYTGAKAIDLTADGHVDVLLFNAPD